MVIASMPFLFYNKIKKYPFVIIAFGVLAIGHGLNAVIETMLFDSYIENTQTLEEEQKLEYSSTEEENGIDEEVIVDNGTTLKNNCSGDDCYIQMKLLKVDY